MYFKIIIFMFIIDHEIKNDNYNTTKILCTLLTILPEQRCAIFLLEYQTLWTFRQLNGDNLFSIIYKHINVIITKLNINIFF